MSSDLYPLNYLFLPLDSSFAESIKSFINEYLTLDFVTFGVHIACAAIIIACITFWVWKPTSDFIDSNRKKLDKDREELVVNTKETRYFLGLLRKEKMRITTARAKIEAEAHREAERILIKARDQAQRLEENMKREAESKILVMEEKAKARINTAVRDLAVELTEKLLEKNINDDSNRAVIDAYIKDLEKRRISSDSRLG